MTFHNSGVGMLHASFSLSKLFLQSPPDLVIQTGVAGAFSTQLSLGQVVTVKNEMLGDIGVEENGVFRDLFDMQLENENQFPFSNKRLENPWLKKYNLQDLREVDSITINEISTRKERIQQLQEKYQPMIESMEGAPLHYIGLSTKVPFIQIRAISNYVGERNKQHWKMNDALDNLCSIVLQYVDKLYKVR
jgi:futalosine hydrolase